MPKIQHRQKIEFNIWVEDKNSVDYYLMDKQFVNCFTSIKVRYKTIYEDNFEPGHNFIIIPIESLNDVPENVSNKINFIINNVLKFLKFTSRFRSIFSQSIKFT